MKTLKKIILAGVAASVVAAPAAAAPYGRDSDRGYDRGRVERVQTTKVVQRANGRQVIKVKQVQKRDSRQAHRNWRKGERFDSRYARSYRVISNPRAYRLHDAPRGYRWVQSGNDAVLVAITSGIIGAVLGNIL
jgi:Ni/Co efflux regulator RcnB